MQLREAFPTIILLSCVNPILGQEWDEESFESDKIVHEDPSDWDSFGYMVDSTREWLVVGVPGDETSPGEAIIYRWDLVDEQWALHSTLGASDGEDGDEFGCAVSIDGSLCIVGACRVDGPGFGASYAGSAYVFRFNPDRDVWEEEQELSGAGDSVDFFGIGVGVSEERIVVGAPGDDEATEDGGAVFVFAWDDEEEEWYEDAKITASDSGDSAEFGYAVQIHEDTIVAGAGYDTEIGTDAGAAYVFRYSQDDETWSEEQKLLGEDTEEGDEFGYNGVSVWGDLVVVGSYLKDGAGAAYVFRRDGDTLEWVEEQKLVASDGEDGDEYAWSVSVNSNTVVVGAADHDDAGAAYVYRWNEDEESWLEEAKLVASDGSSGDNFGYSVSGDGARFVAGAWADDDDATSAGSVYAFDVFEIRFMRGDVDGNGETSALLDALFLLRWAFGEGEAPPCFDAADIDGNDDVSALLDALRLLQWQFADAEAPPSPGPSKCGLDTGFSAGCEEAPDECS